MSEYPELSKLPADDQYWNDLEARILSDLGPRTRVDSSIADAWWTPLAAGAGRLGGLAAAAVIAALLLAPPRAQASLSEIIGTPKQDPLIVALITASSPPSVVSLMMSTVDDD